MPKIPVCPINLPCTLKPFSTGSGRMKCLNSRYCHRLALPWGLPYIYEDNCLTVTHIYAHQFLNEDEQYPDPHYEFYQRIIEDWKEAGWEIAVRNKNYVEIETEDISSPF